MPAGSNINIKHLYRITPAGLAAGPWRRLNLPLSFAVHLAGLALLFFGLVLYEPEIATVWVEIDSLAALAAMCLSILISFLMLQLCVLVLALLTMCWGAGVEPWRASLERSVCRWYQLTPWLALLVLGLVFGFEAIEGFERVYYDTYYNPGPAGIYTVMQEERIWLLLQIARSMLVSATFLLGLWFTLSMLAVHRDRPRWHASCRWPAACAECGYALVGMSDEQTCPECGRPVATSKHTARAPIKDPTLRVMYQAVLSPTVIGERILARRYTTKPTRALLWAVLLVIATGPIGVAMIDIVQSFDYWDWDFYEFVEEYLFTGFMAGVMMATLGALIALGLGSLNGTSARVFGKRDAMVASCKAACLGAGMLPLWSLGNFVIIAVFIFMFEVMEIRLRGAWDLAPVVIILGYHLAMLVFYMIVVGKIERAARHANE